MSEHKRLRVLTNIAGCLLLVSVLHYALDEPTRSVLIRAVIRQRTLTRHNPPDHSLPPTVQQLLHDASFELWDMQSYPTLQRWFTSLTVSAWDAVKKETEIVQHGLSAVRLVCDGFNHCGNVRQELPSEVIPWLRGRWLTFSVWTLSTTPQVPCLYIHEKERPYYKDGEEGTYSKTCLQNPSGTWQLITVERLISPEATRVVLMIETPELSVMEPVYVDNASLEAIPPSGAAP